MSPTPDFNMGGGRSGVAWRADPGTASGAPHFAPAVCRRLPTGAGFTLLELLVASVVLGLLVVLLLAAVEHSGNTFRSLSRKVDAFQEARFAFDLLSRNLGQATLNTFWRQDDADNPRHYLRASDLHFLVVPAGADKVPGRAGSGQAVFFQAPLGATSDPARFGGLPSALNALGYFVDFGPMPQPGFVGGSAPHRFQLMQLKTPTEEMKAFATREQADARNWLDPALHASNIFPVASNIIALVLWPRRTEADPGAALTADYSYNSRADAIPQPVTANQLPPVVEVVLVAIDEESAMRLDQGSEPPEVVANALEGLFQVSNPQQLEDDLDELERRLVEAGIKHRVFRTAVPLRESKWSEQ